MAAKYPFVHGERETVAALKQGASIARFGDGEFKLMSGKAQIREPENDVLARRLMQVLVNPPPSLLLGIPTMDKAGPKYESWRRHTVRYKQFLPETNEYYSAFITRPDSAPWIDTAESVAELVSLWRGLRVALVAEKDTAITRAVSITARYWELVECPHRETSQVMDRLVRQVQVYDPDIALLSCGPAATVMAAELCQAGIQTIDIGSAGQMLLRNMLCE